MMKQKHVQNPNRKIIMSFLLISILVLSYSVTFIFTAHASWTSSGGSASIEGSGASNWKGGVASTNNQIFWDNVTDRWYVLYSLYITGANGHRVKYGYSDSGNVSHWNQGGYVHAYYTRFSTTSQALASGYDTAWCYDLENQVGHIVWTQDYTGSSPYGIFYMNFTIDSGTGVLSFGNRKTIADRSGATFWGAVDIGLSFDNRPIIGYSGRYVGTTYRQYGYICDSLDGYNGNWEVWYSQDITSNSGVSVIPTGNNSAIFVYGYSGNPLDIIDVTFGSTANLTSYTTFSDNICYYESINNGVNNIHYGVAYNQTHGAIAYYGAGNSHAFIFDFETLTRSSESIYSNFSGVWNGAIFHENEAFVTAYERNTLPATDHDVEGSEYHDAGYDDYFNVSATGKIIEPLWNGDDSDYHRQPMTTARVTDDSGVNVIVGTNDGTLNAIWWTLSGEYGEPPQEEWTISDSINLMLTYTMPFMGLVGLVLMVLAPLVIYKKKKKPVDAITYGFIMFILGLGFFVAWVFSGG